MALKVLIIGATSAIAEHCARLWASQGAVLFLVGRNSNKLATIATDLRVRGATAVNTLAVELCALERHGDVVQTACTAMAGLDVALVAHGSLSAPPGSSIMDEVGHMLNVNATSTISVVEHIAAVLESQGYGSIAVISSVAGDRGRASNALYGAAKAAVTAHASATRQRLARCGAWVVTVKPGFVDTPMTSHFPKGPLWSNPQTVAKAILRAMDKRRAVVHVPGYWALIMAVVKALPEFIFLRTRF